MSKQAGAFNDADIGVIGTRKLETGEDIRDIIVVSGS